jgi:NAD(P)-dependent dehydrogenase (short-subunit alcohol dehydrogenase family)
VRCLVAEGGQVVATGTNSERVEKPATELPGTQVLRDDAADAGSRLAEAIAAGGPLDRVWLNAGHADIRAVDEVDAGFFDRVMAVNVRAPFLQLAALDRT